MHSFGSLANRNEDMVSLCDLTPTANVPEAAANKQSTLSEILSQRNNRSSEVHLMPNAQLLGRGSTVQPLDSGSTAPTPEDTLDAQSMESGPDVQTPGSVALHRSTRQKFEVNRYG